MGNCADLRLDVTRIDLALKSPFRISGYVMEKTPVLIATVRRGNAVGRGEAAGVYYLDDTADRGADILRKLALNMPADLKRDTLRTLLPPGGARNALDCALWELEAREAGKQVCELAGLPTPRRLLTTMTLGANDPDVMARGAIGFAGARAIKLKLTGEAAIDSDRVRAVRAARPDVWIGVDANQGYTPDTIEPLIGVLVDCGVSLLEQPFRRGREADLDGLKLPMPVAADESCLDLAELETLPGRFDVVNIKLDKCGGLTEGLLIARRARQLGLQVMVGNMVGTSLSIAPAYVLGQLCDVVDLDGPIFIAEDPAPTVVYDDGHVTCAPEIWGPDAMIAEALPAQ
ncbi:dipeptide epimerase [Novosphingobium sp.]|uniref:dipeptide epimerase n=1 Tax=Novosphingobium sp. TaxID=1874826 RepID=UPI0038BA8E51